MVRKRKTQGSRGRVAPAPPQANSHSTALGPLQPAALLLLLQLPPWPPLLHR